MPLNTSLSCAGDAVAVYSELCYLTALHGVAFHPHENMVAFCAFGQRQPIHTYLYDRKGVFELSNISKVLFFPCKSFHQSCSVTVSQLEIHSIKAASDANKSASGDSRTIRTLQDMSAASALDQFAQTTRLALKTKSVKEQLDSVLVIIRPVSALLNYKIHYTNSTVHLLLCH